MQYVWTMRVRYDDERARMNTALDTRREREREENIISKVYICTTVGVGCEN